MYIEACLNLHAIAPIPLIALAIGVSSIFRHCLQTSFSLENERSSVENDQHSTLLHDI